MIYRIVAIENPAVLSFKNSQLRIERDGEPAAQVPLEDMGVLLLGHAQISATVPLLSACAERNVAVIVSGPKHLPAGVFLPFEGNSLHTRVLREQIAASEPRRKRLWQGIVRSKITEQSSLLREVIGRDRGLSRLAPLVRSGDPENVEGRAARIYFRLLFGAAFVRDRDLVGLNSMLNYGYAVLRAAVARAIVCAGMHPALGVHHSNQYNPFALADDLMEPLRPLVDEHVFGMVQEGVGDEDELMPVVKRRLVAVLVRDVTWDGKRYPLSTALGYYAAAARDWLTGREGSIPCPGR